MIDLFRASVKKINTYQSTLYPQLQATQIKIEDDVRNFGLSMEGHLKLSADLDRLGLASVSSHENSFDYSDLILTSKNLWFVFNDGRTWFSRHEADLADRLKSRDHCTYVLLNDPSSPFLKSLSVKVEQSAEQISAKISESIQKLIRLAHGDHSLKIYTHNYPSAYSLIMNDEIAVLIPYLTARKSDRIPCFLFRPTEGGFYHVIRRDVEELRMQRATQVYPEAFAFREPTEG